MANKLLDHINNLRSVIELLEAQSDSIDDDYYDLITGYLDSIRVGIVAIQKIDDFNSYRLNV